MQFDSGIRWHFESSVLASTLGHLIMSLENLIQDPKSSKQYAVNVTDKLIRMVNESSLLNASMEPPVRTLPPIQEVSTLLSALYITRSALESSDVNRWSRAANVLLMFMPDVQKDQKIALKTKLPFVQIYEETLAKFEKLKI